MSRNVIGFFLCMLFCLLSAGAAWADGAVYAMTNALENNEILVFHRAPSGGLDHAQTIATGGGGSGLQLAGVDSLGSSGSLQLDEDHRFLFAVNTESAAENNGAGAYNTDCQQGTITSFHIAADGTLTFADRVFSGGLFPNSLAVSTRRHGHGDNGGHDADDRDHDHDDTGVVVYVLNAGGPEAPPVCRVTPGTANTPNITGFRVDAAGHLIPLDETQPIDPGPATGPAGGVSCTAAAAAGFAALTGAPAADFQCGLNPPSFPRSPASVRFAPGGALLVVTVKGTNAIYVFPVDRNGKAGTPTVTQFPGPALPTPFGFTFDRQGHLLVTELFGSATSIPAGAAGAVSSFAIVSNGHLQPISSHVADGGTAACWIALEPLTGQFAYVSNNLSASISLYKVTTSGLTLVNGVAATAAGPNDLATAHEGPGASFLYVVAAGTGTVQAYVINQLTGALAPTVGGSGLPANRSAQGLAAY
ncbi:MAG TPA: beta-propeller fold lactonase family protein [Xanthobacteraceae bacterium]|nr:beta-propeller fold lactonase family protein [Xanthobacteraceae bacterium]